MPELSEQMLFKMYSDMLLIRVFEDRSKELFHQKKIGGVYLHLYNGQEATGVGAVYAMKEQDHLITAYRDHGIAIARGVDPKRIMAEMYGKKTGVSGGKGGSMHLADRKVNFWGGYAIVGGQLPLAAGIALKSKYMNQDEVTLCFVGDGATNNGYFHESVNLSAVWDLPVIWLIENNLYGMGTSIEVSSGQTELVKRAIGYGIKEGPRLDGQDLLGVYNAISEAREYASKHGPILIESMTYRYEGHGMSDKMFMHRTDELGFWQEQDPIDRMREYLRGRFNGIDPMLEHLEKKAQAAVDEAERFAEESPEPTYDDLVNNVYA